MEGEEECKYISSLTKIYGKGVFLYVCMCLSVFVSIYRTEITTPVWKIDHNNTFQFGAWLFKRLKNKAKFIKQAGKHKLPFSCLTLPASLPPYDQMVSIIDFRVHWILSIFFCFFFCIKHKCAWTPCFSLIVLANIGIYNRLFYFYFYFLLFYPSLYLSLPLSISPSFENIANNDNV